MTKRNLDLQSAMKDIEVIKQTIEKSKIHFGKLATLFIIFGVTQLCAYIFQQLGNLWFLKKDFFMGVEILYYTKYITLAILFVFYLKMRINIKKSNNIYTLQLFDIWGLILFIVPLVRFSTMLVQAIAHLTISGSDITVFAYASVGFIENVSVLAGVLMTGCILRKAGLKIIALLLLFTYPLLFLIGADAVDANTIISAYGYFIKVNVIAYIITLVLYIVMGIDFKHCNGGDKIETK